MQSRDVPQTLKALCRQGRVLSPLCPVAMPHLCRFCLLLAVCFLLCSPARARDLEILAAGDVMLGGGMLDAPIPSLLFAPETRRRIEQADVFLWNCENAGPASLSKGNLYIFHADELFFPQMRFANGAACTANNHVFDGYEEGAANLLHMLEQNGIAPERPASARPLRAAAAGLWQPHARLSAHRLSHVPRSAAARSWSP